MISLETAKALKDAGLAWEPKIGDTYRQLSDSHLTLIYDANPVKEYWVKKSVWHPRLDQLLAEIVKNIWGCRLSVLWIEDFPTGYECLLSRTEETEEGKWEEFEHCFDSPDSPDEAAAQALLWILNQK
jgi:hypothetical protein